MIRGVRWACGLAMVVTTSSLDGQQMTRQEIIEYAEAQVPAALEMFREYLSIPNDAQNLPDDMIRTAQWYEAALQARGFETEWLETARLPQLFAQRTVPNARRTLARF